jgi:hypothetical protein
MLPTCAPCSDGAHFPSAPYTMSCTFKFAFGLSRPSLVKSLQATILLLERESWQIVSIMASQCRTSVRFLHCDPSAFHELHSPLLPATVHSKQAFNSRDSPRCKGAAGLVSDKREPTTGACAKAGGVPTALSQGLCVAGSINRFRGDCIRN